MASSSRRNIAMKPVSMQITPRGGFQGFRSQREHDWFQYAFRNRTVVIERPVEVESLDDFPQRASIEQRPGWVDYLLNEGNQCNLSLCREFIASLLPVPDENFSFVARVRGVNVGLNMVTVSGVMGIESLPHHEYDLPVWRPDSTPDNDELATFLAGRTTTWIGPTFYRNTMLLNLQTLWLVVANALDPTTHTQHIYPHHALLMEAIARNKPICLVRYVITKIASMYRSSAHNDTIKFGVLLTKVCLGAGVRERAEDQRKMQRSPVNRSSQIRAHGQLRNRPNYHAPEEEEEEEDEEESEEAPVDVETPGSSRRRRRTSSGPDESPQDHVTDSFNVIRTQMEEMRGMMHSGFANLNTQFESMTTRQEQMENEMRVQNAYLREQFEALNMRFPPPPPPDM